jgi:ketosteroid isomerase-like protein
MVRTVKSAAIAAVAFAASVCCGHAFAESFNRPQDVREITDLEMYLAGLTDVDKVIEVFSSDATIADLSAPGWYEGRDSIYSALKPQFDSLQTLRFDIKDINVVTDGQFACAALQIQLKGTLKGGSPLSTTFRELDAFKKVGGHWRWIQQHVSYPVDPKSGRSVTDGPLPVRGKLREASLMTPAVPFPPAQAKVELRSWFEGAAGVTDLNTLTSYFGPGDDVIIYNESIPGELRGLEELRGYYGPVLSGIRGTRANVSNFAADSDGVLGAVIGREDLTIDAKGGATQSLSIRQSDCLRRVDGKWHAFFEMVSFPMDLKTGKAIMRTEDIATKK